MRLDGDGRALTEVNLYLTPGEARELIDSLNGVLGVVPSQTSLSHNHITEHLDRPAREVTLYVYSDPDVERQHDEGFAAGGEWRSE
jgi:hypothetical protein